MFEKKPVQPKETETTVDVFRPTKGSAKVIIGNGVKIKGSITDADEVQIDGSANVTMNVDNLVIGSTGDTKGNIETHNADVWGKIDGDLKVSGTLTVQEQGSVSGTIEYQSLQVKLGGKIKGEIKASDKIKKITDAQKKEQTSSLIQDSAKEQNS